MSHQESHPHAAPPKPATPSEPVSSSTTQDVPAPSEASTWAWCGGGLLLVAGCALLLSRLRGKRARSSRRYELSTRDGARRASDRRPAATPTPGRRSPSAADHTQAPKHLAPAAGRPTLSPPTDGNLSTRASLPQSAVIAELASAVDELRAQLRDLQRRYDELERQLRDSIARREQPRIAEVSVTPAAAMIEPRSTEDQLLQIWNEVDWEHGTPSLSPAEQLLGREGYDLVEGIAGIYALAVPRCPDDALPVLALPLLGKANTLYDGLLFHRPQAGDSELVKAAAKLQFRDSAGARTLSLERLKAGHEKLSQVFAVVELGRIE